MRTTPRGIVFYATIGYPGEGPNHRLKTKEKTQHEFGILFANVSNWGAKARDCLLGGEETPPSLPSYIKVIMNVEHHFQGERLKIARKHVQRAG